MLSPSVLWKMMNFESSVFFLSLWIIVTQRSLTIVHLLLLVFWKTELEFQTGKYQTSALQYFLLVMHAFEDGLNTQFASSYTLNSHTQNHIPLSVVVSPYCKCMNQKGSANETHSLCHRLFLIGLSKFGKGDWRSISRNVVVTRTPTQVASHAQKYFLRQNSGKKERKRSSIHDITTVDSNSVPVPIDQNWVPPPGASMQQSQDMLQYPSSNMHDQMGPFGYSSYGFEM